GPRTVRRRLPLRGRRLARGVGGGAILRHRRDPAPARLGAPDVGPLPGAARERRLLHRRRDLGPELARALQDSGTLAPRERPALREEPPAASEPGRADPADRGGHRHAAGGRVGGEAPRRRRSVRPDPELPAGVRRSAPRRARLLRRRAACHARAGEADRLADADVGDAAADEAGRSSARRAHRGGAARAGLRRRGDQPAAGGPRGANAMNDEILFEVKDGIAWLMFNRPDARNAMTFGMYDRLGELCAQVNRDDSIKVLLL